MIMVQTNSHECNVVLCNYAKLVFRYSGNSLETEISKVPHKYKNQKAYNISLITKFLNVYTYTSGIETI